MLVVANSGALVCLMSKVKETKKDLASLLGDEKAVAPLLKFSKATGIEGTEGARERELEWERKNDQEGEDLLG